MTAIPVQAQGSWLRVTPVANSRAGTRSKRRRGLRLAIVAGSLATAATLLGEGLARVIATPNVDATAAAAAERGAEAAAAAATAAPAEPAVAGPTAPTPPAELAASFERWAAEYAVPVALLEALTWHESRWQAGAVSEAGAMGIGQLMPPTAAAIEAELGVELDPWNPDDNVRMSAALIGTLLASARGDIEVALAGYAQGASSVARHGMTDATRTYVTSIVALHEQFEAARTR